jgi:hypothetical protein
MSTTPLIRVDTTVKTNVKGSKVFALAFVKVTGVTDSFTEDQIRGFVLPKLGDASLLGSAIVQLDSVTSGEKYHSGRGDESFTGILTQVFVLAPDLTTNVTTTVQGADFADSGINVYFMTMDGINETAVSSLMWIYPVPERPLVVPERITSNLGNYWLQTTLTVGKNLFSYNNSYKVTYVHPDFENAWFFTHQQDIYPANTIGMRFLDRTRVHYLGHNRYGVYGQGWIQYNDTPQIFFGQDLYTSTDGLTYTQSGLQWYYKDFEAGDYPDILVDIEDAYITFRLWLVI